MKRVYQCDGCGGTWAVSSLIYLCAGGCDKEICDHCVDRYAHCHDCGAGKTDEELRVAGIEAGFYFSLED